MSSSQKPTSYRVPALEKGLDILEALSSVQFPLSLAELSKMLDRSSSELFRMMDCLEKRGYIIKEPHSGNYILSLKLFELAHSHSPVEQLLKAAMIPMKDFSHHFQESCHLSVLQHDQLIVLAQAESPQKVRLSVEVGGRFSMIHTASGRLLLAHLPSDELELLLAEDEEFQTLTEREQRDFHLKLHQIKDQGYTLSTDETHIGIKDIAVMVGNPRTGPSAALTTAYLTLPGDQRTEHLLAALLSCSQTIHQSLGVTE